MGFMELQVWRENGRYAKETGDMGEGYYPDSYIAACPEAYVVEEGSPSRAMWWAEYSAPGYMDKTDVCYGETAIEAAYEAFRLYGDDTPGSDDRRELAQVIRNIRAQGLHRKER